MEPASSESTPSPTPSLTHSRRASSASAVAAASAASGGSTSDEVAARLADIRQRLHAVSAKHVVAGGSGGSGSSSSSLDGASAAGAAGATGSGSGAAVAGAQSLASVASVASVASTSSVASFMGSAAHSDHRQQQQQQQSHPAAKPSAAGASAPAPAPAPSTSSSFATSLFSGLRSGLTGSRSNAASQSTPTINNQPSLSQQQQQQSTPEIAPTPMPQLAQLPDCDPACVCIGIVTSADPRRCTRCGGGIRPLNKLLLEKLIAEHQAEQFRRKLDRANTRQDESTVEMAKLREKAEKLEDILDHKQYELTQVKRDLEMLGDKLIDEIEKRAEIQHSRDAVQDELEELTKSLFEEANSMVAVERKHVSEFQEREKIMSQELSKTKMQLQLEQAQIRELRIRLGQMQEEQERLLIAAERQASQHQTALDAAAAAAAAISNGKSLHVRTDSQTTDGQQEALLDDLIDQQQFMHFEEFLQLATKAKVNKLHSLTFMRNALEDDITPCLRFGGNPRTSTKKFIDAIIAHNCFVEEMSEAQIQELHDRDNAAANAASEKENATTGSDVGAGSKSSTLSRSSIVQSPLFNKTVLERLTNVLSNANLATLGVDGPSNSSHAGCSTCGRDEPYRYHFKISDISDDQWYPICVNCRDRIVSVCDFYNFVRHVRQGLYSTRSAKDLYAEAIKIKRTMFYSRLGASHLANNAEVFKMIKPVRPNSALVTSFQSSILDSMTQGSNLSPVREGASPDAASASSDTMPLARLQERYRARQQQRQRDSAASPTAESPERASATSATSPAISPRSSSRSRATAAATAATTTAVSPDPSTEQILQ